MVRQRALLMILVTVACSRRPQPPASSASGDSTLASGSRTDSGTSGQASLRPGFYIAPWNDDYQTRWLLLYVSRRFEAVTYDAAEASPLCALRIHRDTVGFTTDQLPFWQTGDRFTFSFLGTLTPTGISGVLLMNGAPYHRRAFSTEFRHYSTDTAISATDTALEGVYASVRMHEETGDLLRDELLLVRTSQGFTAFYTDYEGVPVGPYPSDTFSMHGDTVAIAVGLVGPERPVSRTFILHSLVSKFDSDTWTSDASDKPTHLAKKATVGELFQTSTSRRCAHQPS